MIRLRVPPRVTVLDVLVAVARANGVDPALAVDEARFSDFVAAMAAAKRRRVS